MAHFKDFVEFSAKKITNDGGLILMLQYCKSAEIKKQSKKIKFSDTRKNPKYALTDILELMFLNKCSGYHTQSEMSNSRYDDILNKYITCVSQSTISRLYNKIRPETIATFNTLILDQSLDVIKNQSEMIFDIDSTYVECCGDQEYSSHNYHYNKHGYHPVLISEHYTRLIIGATLRPGNVSCAKGFEEIITSLITDSRLLNKKVTFRMDSAFCSTKIINFLVAHNVNYIIKFRKCQNLIKKISDSILLLTQEEQNIENKQYFGSFEYTSKSYDNVRLFYSAKASKEKNEEPTLVSDIQIIVSNIENNSSEQMFALYNQRGQSETIIRELKSAMRMKNLSHSLFIQNEFELLFSCFGYNIFKLFLKQVNFNERDITIVVFCRDFFKIGGYLVTHGRKTTIQLSDSFRRKKNL